MIAISLRPAAISKDRVVCPNPAMSSALVKIPLKPDENLPDLRRTAQIIERIGHRVAVALMRRA
ncbi:MAG: hypothetical protein WAW46_09815 [Polaromonas sp.]